MAPLFKGLHILFGSLNLNFFNVKMNTFELKQWNCVKIPWDKTDLIYFPYLKYLKIYMCSGLTTWDIPKWRLLTTYSPSSLIENRFDYLQKFVPFSQFMDSIKFTGWMLIYCDECFWELLKTWRVWVAQGEMNLLWSKMFQKIIRFSLFIKWIFAFKTSHVVIT